MALSDLPEEVLADCMRLLLVNGHILSFDAASCACRALQLAGIAAASKLLELDAGALCRASCATPLVPGALHRLIPHCKSLQSLCLSASPMCSSHLLALANEHLSQLQHLDLSHCHLAGRAVDVLIEASWPLHSLRLAHASLGVTSRTSSAPSSSRKGPKPCFSLTRLDLSYASASLVTKLVRRGNRQLDSPYPGVRELSLRGVDFSPVSAVLRRLSHLFPALRALDLAVQPVAGADLALLASEDAFPDLCSLVLGPHTNNITSTGTWGQLDLDRLRRARPGLQIAWASA